MNAPKLARRVVNKHGATVLRCGWGTFDGRGCQETLGALENFCTQDGVYKYPRILLAPGYERRPDSDKEAGRFVHTNRPSNRSYRSKDVKEHTREYQQSDREEREEMITFYRKFCANPDNPPDQIEDFKRRLESLIQERSAPPRHELEAIERHKAEKSKRNEWQSYLIDKHSLFAFGEPLFHTEQFLPAIMRCKVCKHLTIIKTAAKTP